MMKKWLYISILIMLFSCNSKNGWDCFQTEGDRVQSQITVSDFERILVNRDVELIITEGPEHMVVIESGENLINDIEVKVVGDQLQISDMNTCNFVREYGITKAYVKAPNLSEIRNSSQFEVSSDGLLNYPNLVLNSEDFNEPGSFTVGDFNLQLNAISLQIISNNISSFHISGQVENLNLGFFAGAGRFEGADLIAQHVLVFHRGSNDMVVNPQQSLIGELRSTGDLISVNTPPMVNVQQFYTGQLIFID